MVDIQAKLRYVRARIFPYAESDRPDVIRRGTGTWVIVDPGSRVPVLSRSGLQARDAKSEILACLGSVNVTMARGAGLRPR